MKKDKALSLVDSLVLKGICHRGLYNDIYPENSLVLYAFEYIRKWMYVRTKRALAVGVSGLKK